MVGDREDMEHLRREDREEEELRERHEEKRYRVEKIRKFIDRCRLSSREQRSPGRNRIKASQSVENLGLNQGMQ